MARKYERGERIISLMDFLNQEYIWWMGKVYCRGFAYSWQLSWILQRIHRGEFYKAIKKPIDKNKEA